MKKKFTISIKLRAEDTLDSETLTSEMREIMDYIWEKHPRAEVTSFNDHESRNSIIFEI